MNLAFLHGGGQGDWVWDQTVEALRTQSGEAELNILLLNAPGCGAKRDRETDGLTLKDVAQELVRDVRDSGLRDVVLVGHSQAGQAMALMMSEEAELFRRFIYVSCSIPLPGQSVQQMIGNSLQGTNPAEVGWPLDPQTTTMEERYDVMFCNDMDAATKAAFLTKLGRDQWPLTTYGHTAWNHDALHLVPSSYVLCLQDRILSPSWQEIFARRFKTERTVVIDAGHQAMITRPHALAEILRLEATSPT